MKLQKDFILLYISILVIITGVVVSFVLFKKETFKNVKTSLECTKKGDLKTKTCGLWSNNICYKGNFDENNPFACVATENVIGSIIFGLGLLLLIISLILLFLRHRKRMQ